MAREYLQPVIDYIGTLLNAARADLKAADPADVGMSGIPITAWRGAYLEGCRDMASGVLSRLPEGIREQAIAEVKAALSKATPSDASQADSNTMSGE